jgi:ribosomal protein S19
MKTYGIEIKDRRSTIIPDFIDKIVKVHKGNGYVAIEINKEHVGLKFGNLVRTKKIPEYKKKKKK